jgi:hypothetical protein
MVTFEEVPCFLKKLANKNPHASHETLKYIRRKGLTLYLLNKLYEMTLLAKPRATSIATMVTPKHTFVGGLFDSSL